MFNPVISTDRIPRSPADGTITVSGLGVVGKTSISGSNVLYFELVDGNTLQSIADWKDTDCPVGCITVFCGEVRLIDNIKYKER